MIKEGIEKILSLAPVQQLPIDGREYTNQAIYPVKAPLLDDQRSNLDRHRGLHQTQC